MKEQLSITQRVFARLKKPLYEDIIRRPKELLQEVFEHLGVSCDVDWASFPYNEVIYKGSEKAMPEKYRLFLAEMYRGDLEGLRARFEDRVQGWLDG